MTSKYGISRWSVAFALVLTAAACGGSDDETAADDQAADTAALGAPPMEAATAESGAPITAADLDAYERGMQKEKEIVEEIVKKAENATSDGDQMQLMMAAMEDQTIDDGAQAAGLSLERYRDLRNRMTNMLGASSRSIMGSALRDQARQSEAEVDNLAKQGLPAAQIEQMRQSNKQMIEQLDAQEKTVLDQLAPDARETFNQRVLRLDSLRMTTVGLRVKVAS